MLNSTLALHSKPTPSPPASFPHSYATRKRQNSVIRPSMRTRDSSPSHPRRIRPLCAVMPNGTNTMPSTNLNTPPSNPIKDSKKTTAKDKHLARKLSDALTIHFPPDHVVLHPDDANNKVFIAIGRAFLAVVCTLSSSSSLYMRVSDVPPSSRFPPPNFCGAATRAIRPRTLTPRFYYTVALSHAHPLHSLLLAHTLFHFIVHRSTCDRI